MRRKYLSAMAAGVSVLGIALATLVSIEMMLPNEKQKGNLARIKTSEIASGTYLEIRGLNYQAFVLRTFSGELKIFAVPFQKGKYFLPDPHWSRPLLPCDKFGPDANGDKLVVGGEFKCQDSVLEDTSWWITDLAWTYDGESKQSYSEDMQSPKYDVIDGVTILK